jgi:SPP1 family phage portal protein
MKEMGALVVPAGDVKYLIKDLPVEFFRELLDRLESNIYRFSQLVNMSNESFSGNAVSGVSRLYQLLPMENKCSAKERFYSGALYHQFQVICSGWKLLGKKAIPETFDFKFNRNLPSDTKYYAEVLSELINNVPLEEAYKQIPFIDDVVAVAAKMKEEQASKVDFDQIPDDPE